VTSGLNMHRARHRPFPPEALSRRVRYQEAESRLAPSQEVGTTSAAYQEARKCHSGLLPLRHFEVFTNYLQINNFSLGSSRQCHPPATYPGGQVLSDRAPWIVSTLLEQPQTPRAALHGPRRLKAPMERDSFLTMEVFGASRAITRDHSRLTFSCKLDGCRRRRCVARRRAWRF
jgi:hypothetical protein